MSPQLQLELTQYLAQLHPNLRAWGDMLRVCEGTSTNPLTVDDGYDVIVTGVDEHDRAVPEVFTDYSHHPFVCPARNPKLINRAKGLYSDAAGGFQLMARYWAPYKLQLRLPDFGPTSQWKVMLQQTGECHALDDIRTGHLTVAVGKCSSRWASLPGNTAGQHQVQLSALEEIFERAGGTFA